MKTLKILYLFILWTLFWISITFGFWFVFLDYVYDVHNIQNPDQITRLNPSNLLSSLKESLKSLPLWSSNQKYEKFDKISSILEKQYYKQEKLDFDKMLENSIKSYVEAIWDPYTMYFTTQENKEFQEDLKWEKDFEWVWAVVAKKENWVMVEEVIKWLPAFNAWIKPLDIILEINWEKTKDMSLNEAVSKIRWPVWSEVELTIYRKWENNVLKIKIKREKIVLPSVMWKIINLSWWINLWYINISIIWEDTERAFRNVINDFKWQSIKWIILDLRWNWWWFLPIAVEICSHFIPEKEIIVTSKYRIYPAEEYKSEWYWEFQWMPIVVLVDWMSASASEIISSALKEKAWAILVWTKTFWKWSIQTVSEDWDWSSLKYTIWNWYPPSWNSVDWVWIKPDVEIELDKDKYQKDQTDSQLEEAKKQILQKLK